MSNGTGTFRGGTGHPTNLGDPPAATRDNPSGNSDSSVRNSIDAHQQRLLHSAIAFRADL